MKKVLKKIVMLLAGLILFPPCILGLIFGVFLTVASVGFKEGQEYTLSKIVKIGDWIFKDE